MSFLNDFEFWHCNREYNGNNTEQKDDCCGNNPTERNALVNGHNDSARSQYRCVTQHTDAHIDEHLNLRDIVCAAGDQRCGGKLVKFMARKTFHAPEQIMAHPFGDSCGNTGTEESDSDAGSGTCERDQYHLESFIQNVTALDF